MPQRENTFTLNARIAGKAKRLVAGISVPVIAHRPAHLPARPDRDGRPMDFDFLYVILPPASIDQDTAATLHSKAAKGRSVRVEGYLQQRDIDQPLWYVLKRALSRDANEALKRLLRGEEGLSAQLAEATVQRSVVDLVATRFEMAPVHTVKVALSPVEDEEAMAGKGNGQELLEAVVSAEEV